MPDYTVVLEPVPGSPRSAYYVLDLDDDDFELGPFHTIEQAHEELADHRNEED